jgi:hypothetical protein
MPEVMAAMQLNRAVEEETGVRPRKLPLDL